MRICHPGIFCEQLEERIVLDASLAPTDKDNPNDNPLNDGNQLLTKSPGQPGAARAEAPADDAPASIGEVFENDLNVVLISNALDNIEGLTDAADENSEVIVFDSQNDNLESISITLGDLAESRGQKIDGLAILEHGSEGIFSIGTDDIGFFNVSQFASSFEIIAGSLDHDSQIQIFGCSVAGDFFGESLLNQISGYTGADVFASVDQTGGEQGDWVLEYSSEQGSEMKSILDAEALISWDGELADTYPAYEDNWAISLNKTLYYVNDDGMHGKELWRSDGTADGTYMVMDINQGAVGSDPTQIMILNGKLVFAASDGKSVGNHGRELWTSDGTVSGTHMLKDINSQAQQDSDPQKLTIVNNTLFFTADDLTGVGRELWKSDGTSAGTVMVKDINPSGDSNATELTNVDGTLFFRADGGKGTGVELWKSDGTESGTQMVMDINPGMKSSDPTEFTTVGSTLYFRADGGKGFGVELWMSDGTGAGTSMVMDINPNSGDSNPTNLTEINGQLFFSATDGVKAKVSHGTEAWVTDGVTTKMISDINPGKSDSNPSEFTLVNGEVYFIADDGVHGTELWKTDISGAGANMVMDIYPGPQSSSPTALWDYDGVLLFAADDGVHGYEPWRSDGSLAGTFLFEDINPNGSSFPINHARVNPLFFLADDGNGYELWRSDGTAKGTVKVSDVRSSDTGSSPKAQDITKSINSYNHNTGYDALDPGKQSSESELVGPEISALSLSVAKAPQAAQTYQHNKTTTYEVTSGGGIDDSGKPFYEKVSEQFGKNGDQSKDQVTEPHFTPGITKVVILSAGHYSITSNAISLTITPNVWLPEIVEWYLVAISEGRYKAGTLPPEHERMIWDFLSYLQKRKNEDDSQIGKIELRLAWQWAEWRKQMTKDHGDGDPLPWSYFRGLSQALTVFYGRGNSSSVDYAEAISALQHNADRLSIIPLTLPNGEEAPNLSDISKYISNSSQNRSR